MRRTLLTGILIVIALTGCARALGRAETALYGGRYEAAARFQEVLNENPDSVDARVRLGIARYRLALWTTRSAPSRTPSSGRRTCRFPTSISG